jgi:4-hydroxy-3-polyprenylbenzoate decarboxylase
MELPVFSRDRPAVRSLGEFVTQLESEGDVLRIREPASTVLEATEIHRRVIASRGPVLRFEATITAGAKTSGYPLLVNLFGTPARVAAALGATAAGSLSALGELLAHMRQPTLPRDLRDGVRRWPQWCAALKGRPEWSGGL